MLLRNKIVAGWAAVLCMLAFSNSAQASLTYTFNSATDVAITSSSNYTASGALSLSLGFAPTPGTNLTVVKNTGTTFISGIFSSVPQGGEVPLTYNGIIYNYIANYYGGNGRSLVLQWPRTGLASWGLNSSGQLGNNSTSNSSIPVAVNANGVIAGKTVVAVAGGGTHTLALTSDGQIFAWGANGNGQLGNNSTTSSSVPIPVSIDGQLLGKTVVAVAAGGAHNLALTSEGQVFAWGLNSNGELGNNSTISSSVPIPVSTTGVLAGKIVVAISAGKYHCMALTSEGQVFAWGLNAYGELGNNSTTTSKVPVPVNTSGLLVGKTVVAIAAGGQHSVAMTSEGQAFAWGDNTYGQLGNNSTTNSSVPVAVDTSGVLNGKILGDIAAGNDHSVALTSEGKVFAWGFCSGGIGNGSSSSKIPVAVNTSGVLSGKSVVGITTGQYHHILAMAVGGQVFAWGYNLSGQLGNNSTSNSAIPVSVSASGALTDNSATAIAAGDSHSLAVFGAEETLTIVANPLSQTAIAGTTVTFTATAMGASAATLQWQVSTTGALGTFTNIVANASATMGTLTLPNVTLAQNGYAYRAVFTNGLGSVTTTSAVLTVKGAPTVVTNPVNQSVLSGVPVSFSAGGTDADTIQWQVSTTGANGIFNDIVANASAATGTLTLSNVVLAQSGYAYRAVFSNTAGTSVSAAATLTVNPHVVHDLQTAFATDGDVGVAISGEISVSGTLAATLGFAPTPGTNLTVINNSGLSFISGTFSNVPQGGIVHLAFNGVIYNYVANYYGGNGRSLVLQWPCTGIASWGLNSSGQLGNNSTATSMLPVAVSASGAMLNKTITAVTGGGSHTLALSSDGQVFAWGLNSNGQLGDNSTTSSPIAVPINTTGLLFGKTVVAIGAGYYHSLALTSEGQVFAWGLNSSGQLGNNSTGNSSNPVAVNASGALAGKTVVAIAAGESHNLALTSEGQIFAWGLNSSGQLGNNSTAISSVPVPVDTSGVLAGKTVIAIASHGNHSLALTSDGQVFAWGANGNGQLGNNSTVSSSVPVAVVTSMALAGKTVSAIAAGSYHSLAVTSDGLSFAWGFNSLGQLGTNDWKTSSVPVPVYSGGVLNGKTITAVVAGDSHSLATTSERKVFSWGNNSNGQLGNNLYPSNTIVPVAVQGSTNGVLTGKNVMSVAAGTSHSVATFGSGTPTVTTNPVSQTVTAGAPASFSAAAADIYSFTTKWQVSTAGTNGVFSDVVANASATTGTFTLPSVTPSLNGYAYRAVFSNNVGSSVTSSAVLTVTLRDLLVAFNSGTDVAVTMGRDIAVSGSLNIQLGFAPAIGTNLTVINNTGLGFISGTFINVPQGGIVPLTYNGVTYNFVANYYGGNGRSLVLQWPCTGLASWGDNSYGELGNGDSTSSSLPVAVNASSMLAGKTVLATAAGAYHSMALTSEGKVYAWGYNYYGQLGNSSKTNSAIPVLVGGTLTGKTVVAIAAGGYHSLALASDGQVFAWGHNLSGQLGNNSALNSSLPVTVSASGALAGKAVQAIAAGYYHSLALTSDGLAFSWGDNLNGQLGNSSTSNSLIPVAANANGALAGKTLNMVAAGAYHSLALSSDGKVFAWGLNSSGQLGNNSTTESHVPVNIVGAVTSKTVMAISGGAYHSMSLSSEGQIFAWGLNSSGQLGNGSQIDSSVPLAVGTDGNSLLACSAGYTHSLSMYSASPLSVTTHPSNQAVLSGTTVSFTASATGSPFATIQWQASSAGANGTFSNIVSNVTATTGTLTLPAVTTAQRGYAYRAVFTRNTESITSNPAVLTVGQPPMLNVPADITRTATSKDGTTVVFNLTASDYLDGVLTPIVSTPSGSMFPIGITTVNCSAMNSLGAITTASFTVSVTRTFFSFQDQYGLQSSTPTADPYQIGINNLISYAFGLNPAAPDRTLLPSVSPETGYLQISYPRWKNPVDINYVVEVSSDLKNWYSGSGYTQQVSVTPVDSMRDMVVERDIISISASPKRFIRIRVVK